MQPIRPDPTCPGQESVWDHPRPAVAEITAAHLRIEFAGIIIAETRRAVRTPETSQPPNYYIPLEDIAFGVLVPADGGSFCEWKGHARYLDVVASYPDPTPPFASLRDHVAFYAAATDPCYIDGECALPQPGGFYGGWITSKVAGPFEGVSGSRFW